MRVKPVPLQIILQLITYCYNMPDPTLNAIGNMITLGFFFLLRPGEYASTDNDEAAPFRVCNVRLLCNNIHLNPYTCMELDLHTATHVSLEFTKQKNGIRGELVSLGRSGHPLLCPVHAMIQRLRHFCLHNDTLAHPHLHILYQCNII
jgi:hypothetical protein